MCMSASWLNGGQNSDRSQNRQEKEEVSNRDIGIGNGTQHSGELNIFHICIRTRN